MLLSFAVHFNWAMQQLDVKNAFLNGDLEEEAFMDLPLGFKKKNWRKESLSIKEVIVWS